jgi:phosphate-selective porin
MKLNKFLISIFSLIFIFASSGIFAQGCGDDDEVVTDDEGKPKIFGFIQPQYEFHFTDNSETADVNENTNSFKFKRARIGVKGNIPYDFKYYVVLENSAFVGGGYPYLLDAFVSYTRFKWVKISVGSFKQPFGLETNTACHSLHTINRSQVNDQVIAPQRDMGIMILGGTNETLLKYSVAVMNGRGLSIKDNNSMKDFIGRVTVKPVDFLRIGGSFRYGFPNSLNTETNSFEERLSYAGELELSFGDFLLQGEYIADEGDYSTASGGGCGSDPLLLGEKRGGFFAQAMYMLPFNLQPVVKFEMFDQDLDNDETISSVDNMYTFTAGLNYFFNDNTRLQVNYLYNAEKGVGDNIAETPNDALLMQLQIKF